MKKKPSPQTDSNSFWETEEFKRLNAKWQAKVQKAGHNELEMGELGGSNPYLKRWDSTWFTNRRHGAQGTRDQMVYFQECTRYLNEYNFESVLDKRIWECYTEGLTIAQTVKKLYRFKTKVKYGYVNKTVNRIKKELMLEFRRDANERN